MPQYDAVAAEVRRRRWALVGMGLSVTLVLVVGVLKTSVSPVIRMRDTCRTTISVPGDAGPSTIDLPCNPQEVSEVASWRWPAVAAVIIIVGLGGSVLSRRLPHLVTSEAETGPTGGTVRVDEFPARGFVQPWGQRIGYGLGVAVLAGIWTLGMVDGVGPEPGWVDYAGFSLLLAVSAAGLLRAMRLGVRLGDEGVTIVRFFSAPFLPWRSVVACESMYEGLRVETTEGVVVRTMMFGVPRWRTWYPRPSRGERLAEHLARCANLEREADLSAG